MSIKMESKIGVIMQKNRMFKLVRELVEEVPSLEKWSLKQLVNPDDPKSIKISPMKIAVMWKTFGEFQLGNNVLAVTQEHRMGQPPKHLCFSLQDGLCGDSIIYSINNDKIALLAGEIGSSDGKMFPLTTPTGASKAVVEWLEELAENTYWEM